MWTSLTAMMEPPAVVIGEEQGQYCMQDAQLSALGALDQPPGILNGPAFCTELHAYQLDISYLSDSGWGSSIPQGVLGLTNLSAARLPLQFGLISRLGRMNVPGVDGARA